MKKEKMLVGFSGCFRVGQDLQYAFEPPTYDGQGNVMKYLVTKFIPCAKKYLVHDSASEVELLIGFSKQLFKIECDGSVSVTNKPFHAIGITDAAMGSFYTTEHMDTLTSWDKLELACQAAEQNDWRIKKPFATRYLMQQ